MPQGEEVNIRGDGEGGGFGVKLGEVLVEEGFIAEGSWVVFSKGWGGWPGVDVKGGACEGGGYGEHTVSMVLLHARAAMWLTVGMSGS
jgi:hypothetical protein